MCREIENACKDSERECVCVEIESTCKGSGWECVFRERERREREREREREIWNVCTERGKENVLK